MVAIILLLTIFYDIPHSYAETESVIVNSSTLHIRSGPGLTYSVEGKLKQGQEVEVVSKSGDWLEIRVNEQLGWIASWLTESVNQSANTDTIIVSRVNQLNVRSGPSTGSAVISKMQAGEEAVQNGQDGEWISVIFNGMNGWVHSDYISPTASKSVSTPSKQVSTEQTFTVSVDALNVRTKPDLKSKKTGIIHKGESYTVTKVEGNWLQISLADKKQGWVYIFHGVMSDGFAPTSTTISDESSPAPQSVTILSMGTNIRESASTSSQIALRADAGEKFEIVSQSGDWYEISLPNGTTAFVANWVISTEETTLLPTQVTPKKPKRVPGTLKGLTIVVDPGHGGNDRGTTGVQGTDEKDITLQTSELVASKLKAAGANVVLTRESDMYVALRKRVAIAHQSDADAFVSIHYDANPDQSVTGFTTYYTHSHQQLLASNINEGLESAISLRNRGHQPADYLVLRENRTNAVLIELGFLSNSYEERIMTTNMFREQAAHGIYNGLLNYFNTNE